MDSFDRLILKVETSPECPDFKKEAFNVVKQEFVFRFQILIFLSAPPLAPID
jgi:hypothetical protein